LLRLLNRTAGDALAESELLGGCGGSGRIGELFRRGVDVAICDRSADGIIGVFVWQTACGALLMTLALLLPVLWHSQLLLPMACRCPSRPSFFVQLRDEPLDPAPAASPEEETLRPLTAPEARMPLPLLPAPPSVAAASGAEISPAPPDGVPRQCSTHEAL